MVLRCFSIGCLWLGVVVCAWADDPAAVQTAPLPTVDTIVDLLKKLEADPASRSEAEKSLKDGLEDIRKQVKDSEAPLDAAPGKMGPTRDERNCSLKLIRQPFALSSRLPLAAYRRACLRESRHSRKQGETIPSNKWS